MSPRNPTFIVKNGEGSSYLFRIIIPLDLRNKIDRNNIKSVCSKEIRISLLTGLKSEAKQLAQVLKIKADLIFQNIRSDNISGYCVKKIKAELKAHLYQIRSNVHNGEQVINEPNISSSNLNFNRYRQPMEQKLTEDYIRRLKFEDYEAFCETHDIEFNEGDYPKKGALLKRRILSKKVEEEIGYREFAMGLASDILIDHLSNIDFEGFKDFFHRHEIDDDDFMEIYDPLGDMSVEQFVSLLEKEYDIVPIARRIGVHRLFMQVEHVYENNQSESEEEPLKKTWDGLKSGGNQSNGVQVSSEGESAGKEPENVKKLSTVFNEYIAEMTAANVWNTKSEKEKRASLNGLIDIIGDIPIDKLSFDIGRMYKQTLMQLPANRNKNPRYRDLIIEDILKLDDVKPMSVRTVNNNLATVIASMNWARKHGYVKENYFEGLKLPSTKKAQDERKPFSDEDLKRIFDPEVFKQESADFSHRYWVTLIAMYSGARINEICQLHVKDIKQEDGLWCMHITEEGKDKDNPKRLKNKASERLIPFHNKLIELGFIDYVKKQKKSKVVRLFPDLYYSVNDGYSRKVGRWFNEQYLRKKMMITDPAKSFHSFRHTVADRLKQLGVAESFIAELLGHSSGDTMSFGRYGKRYQPQVLKKEAVQRIEFLNMCNWK